LRENAELWEKRGKDDKRALSALRLAFELDPDIDDNRAELERVAEKTKSWDTLADAYESGIKSADPLVKRQLLSSLATLHDQKRDDPRRALDAYERLFETDPTDPEPLDQMDMLATLLSGGRRWSESSRKRPNSSATIRTRRRSHGASARPSATCSTTRRATLAYERALELDPESTFTIDSLIDLYEKGDDHLKLVDLYRRRVEQSSADDQDLKFTLLVQAADEVREAPRGASPAIDCLREAAIIKPADRASSGPRSSLPGRTDVVRPARELARRGKPRRIAGGTGAAAQGNRRSSGEAPRRPERRARRLQVGARRGA
jgi:tetratricopeptide (TPR) repeat protein